LPGSGVGENDVVNRFGDQDDLPGGGCDYEAGTMGDQCTVRAGITAASNNGNPADRDLVQNSGLIFGAMEIGSSITVTQTVEILGLAQGLPAPRSSRVIA